MDIRRLGMALAMTVGLIGTLAIGLPGQQDYLPAISDRRALEIKSAVLSTQKAQRYGLVEIRVDLAATFQNAFDPEQIDLHAIVTSPSSKQTIVPGFFFQDYKRSLQGSQEQLEIAGESGWRIRYAPSQVGKYWITIEAKDTSNKVIRSKRMSFECVKSNSQGYVRISKKNRRFFAIDDGKSYFPIGANVCWGNSQGTYSYDSWLPEYGKSGCNYLRVWLSPGFTTFCMESPNLPLDRAGVGKINLANAWRLDYVLDLAKKNGLRAMLCVDSFNMLRKGEEGSYGGWEDSCFNKAKGGPLNEPSEFWDNPQMIKAYRNKLRYLVARYGWRTNVLSWEFWNEVDIISPTAWNVEKAAQWHRDMARYLKEIDPWKHLITTSFAFSEGISQIDSLPEIEYTQVHNYGSKDIPAFLASTLDRHSRYNKPCYVGEFGADVDGKADRADTSGVALHEGIWSTAMSGASGAAMQWWWDSQIHPYNLYYHFAALAAFLRDVEFADENFVPVRKAEFTQQSSQKNPIYLDIDLGNSVSWQPSIANRPTTVVLDSKKGLTCDGEVSAIQHGLVNHRELHNPLTIKTDLERSVRFIVTVSGVSGYGGAALDIKLDGKSLVHKDMPDEDQTKETIDKYDGAYSIQIPAGKHTVVVENTGTDWFYVGYKLENALITYSPNLRMYALRGKKTSLVWIQNLTHNWYNVLKTKGPVQAQPASTMTLSGWPEGQYSVQIWDTIVGRPLSKSEIRCIKGKLYIKLPEIETDIALKLIKQ